MTSAVKSSPIHPEGGQGREGGFFFAPTNREKEEMPPIRRNLIALMTKKTERERERSGV
jgi:hypothetical protein